ncbi:MAG: transglycosylase domain-containing protein [Hymenobacter sp.]
MAPSVPLALVAAEDQRFLLHHGFDADGMWRAAQAQLATRRRPAGAWAAPPSRSRWPKTCFFGRAAPTCARPPRPTSRCSSSCCGASAASWKCT